MTPARGDPTAEARALERLADIVADDVRADLARAEDRATNAARRVVLEAEDRVADLERSAKALGALRGAAVDASEEQAADREIATLGERAFAALAERFLARVVLALKALPGSARHERALSAWAAESTGRSDRPADVFVESALRPRVYDALLAAGAKDLRVHADPRVHVGFVVRDLDGRTLLDRRPEALVAERRDELLRLLRERLPPPPAGDPPPAPPGVGPSA